MAQPNEAYWQQLRAAVEQTAKVYSRFFDTLRNEGLTREEATQLTAAYIHKEKSP